MASEASRSVRNEAQPARRSGKSIVYSKHSNPLNILLKAPGDQFEASKIVWILCVEKYSYKYSFLSMASLKCRQVTP